MVNRYTNKNEQLAPFGEHNSYNSGLLTFYTPVDNMDKIGILSDEKSKEVIDTLMDIKTELLGISPNSSEITLKSESVDILTVDSGYAPVGQINMLIEFFEQPIRTNYHMFETNSNGENVLTFTTERPPEEMYQEIGGIERRLDYSLKR